MDSNIINEIEAIQQDFYSKNGKNLIQKKNQKNDLAILVSNEIDLNRLFNKMCFVIKGTNKIVIDYNIFKSFVHNENYKEVIDSIISIIKNCIKENSNFELNLNINGFTISAAERYKDAILYFTEITAQTELSNVLNIMNIYFPPVIIDQLKVYFLKFIHPEVKKRINIISKKDSEESWNSLFN